MSSPEETCEELEPMAEGNEQLAPDKEQDKQYILHIASEFTTDTYKSSQRDLIYIPTIVMQNTNAIQLPSISTPITSADIPGFDKFIAYIFSLTDSTNKTYFIVCDVKNMREYIINKFGFSDRDINNHTRNLGSFEFALIHKLETTATVSSEAPREITQLVENPDYEPLSTSYRREPPYINVPVVEPVADSLDSNSILKIFRFTSNAYSVDDYLKESKFCPRKITNPAVIKDPPITLWGIFTCLLRSYVFQDKFFKSVNSTTLNKYIPSYYSSYDIKCLMTTVLSELSLYSKLSVDSNFEINVSFLLSRSGYTVVDNIEQKNNMMLRFFNYLIQIDTVLNESYTETPSTEKTIIYNIKEQLSNIINFFNNGHKVIFIFDSIHNVKIEYYIDADKLEIVSRSVSTPIQSVQNIYSEKIVPINASTIILRKGMCRPTKGVSLDKLSQHCENLYYGRIVNKDVFSFFTGDKISKCANRLQKTKDIHNTYLQNCQVSRYGGTYKKKKRTQKKSRRTKRKTNKQRKKKSPFLYR